MDKQYKAFTAFLPSSKAAKSSSGTPLQCPCPQPAIAQRRIFEDKKMRLSYVNAELEKKGKLDFDIFTSVRQQEARRT
jgi:hypothetical protein